MCGGVAGRPHCYVTAINRRGVKIIVIVPPVVAVTALNHAVQSSGRLYFWVRKHRSGSGLNACPATHGPKGPVNVAPKFGWLKIGK